MQGCGQWETLSGFDVSQATAAVIMGGANVEEHGVGRGGTWAALEGAEYASAVAS